MIPFEKDGSLVNAESIRKSLGDFSEYETKPAKMAARMARKCTNICKPLINLISLYRLQRRSLRLTRVLPWYEASGKTWKTCRQVITSSRTVWGRYPKNLDQGFGKLYAKTV